VVLWLWPRNPCAPPAARAPGVERLPANPVIHAGLASSLRPRADTDDYVNINWPSLIRVPDWVEDPLGRYYLYFSHHKGNHIRLAYADDFEDSDGRRYLLYVGRGEKAIGIAKLSL
jgi:hypothetical protein